MTKLTACWVLFWWIGLVFAGAFDWTELRKELNNFERDLIVGKIVERWEDRPPDFFQTVNEELLREIIPHLSDSQIKDIRPESFEFNKSACRAFASHLSKLSNSESLPATFRKTIFKLIKEQRDESKGFEEITQLIRSIPSSWMETHGSLFMGILSNSGLKYLNKLTLATLLKNSNEACRVITFDTLLSLDVKDLKLLSPECVKVINGLGEMDLSGIIQSLREDAFAEYNGRLRKETIQKLSVEQLWNYGFLITDGEICTLLELHYISPAAAAGIHSSCLYGYLNSNQKEIGLGELWKSISARHLNMFTYEMRQSWTKIPPKDFDSMTDALLKIILPNLIVCPTVELSFWTEERIKYASSECLHSILIESKAPVKLGKLWDQIESSALSSFTNEMKNSWMNIDHGDFCLMKPEVLKIILSSTKVCSTLQETFWTKETIRYIPGRCLHKFLTKDETPTKLEELWREISLGSIYSFTRRTKLFWDCIHPDDKDLVKSKILEAVRPYPGICSTLDISFWNKETAKYISEDCLCKILSKEEKPVQLGKLWKYIPHHIVLKFKFESLDLLRNVAGNDFQYMPPLFLKIIFSSYMVNEFLPQPATGIILSSKARKVEMNSIRFAEIIKPFPSVAGQLLWYSEKLPDYILSRCDGNDIRSLKLSIPGEADSDWKSLFNRLEEKYRSKGQRQYFSRMVQLISSEVGWHFCATLLDPEEYLSLTWLHQNLGSDCLSELRFNPYYISNLFNRPELFQDSLPWEKMLETYSLSDWGYLSQSKRISALLGGVCEFWVTIMTNDWLKLLDVLEESILKDISVECIFKLTSNLRQNTRLIPLLADDAFSYHQINQFPCRLQNLSPEQISQLSRRTIRDYNRPTSKEISQHVLSGVTLKDLKVLNLEQFKSLYKSQWYFVPESMKSEALSWQLQAAQLRVINLARDLDGNNTVPSNGSPVGDQIDKFEKVKDTLGLIIDMYKDNDQRTLESTLLSFTAFMRNSYLREVFIRIIGKSTLLGPLGITLIRNAKELRNYNLKVFKKMDDSGDNLAILNNHQFGFDRSIVLNLLRKTPHLFAASSVQVSSPGITDNGGPIRTLTSQLLNDIQRDLTVACMGGTLSSFKVQEITRANPVSSPLKVKANDENGNAKFSWGISRDAGLVVGLVFGKALQLEIHLPFSLSREFYELLIDNSDKSIEKYYKDTYSQEISKFKQGIISLFKIGNLEEPLQVLTRPESLRFTDLSTMASTKAAKGDTMAKTNLWGCGGEDCYNSIQELEEKNFPENYIESVLKKIQQEFKEFVYGLVKGLGMALPPVNDFGSLPKLFLRPFADFLPELLNAEAINANDFIKRINIFHGDTFVIFADRELLASKVLAAFTCSLSGSQLSHLLGVWSGSSTLSLEYMKLEVVYIVPNDQTLSINLDFCDCAHSLMTQDELVVAPGKEYKELFGKFIKKLLKTDGTAEPYCPSGGLEFYPTRISTCAKLLTIYLQSVQQMFNSLVDLINTPLAAIRDN